MTNIYKESGRYVFGRMTKLFPSVRRGRSLTKVYFPSHLIILAYFHFPVNKNNAICLKLSLVPGQMKLFEGPKRNLIMMGSTIYFVILKGI